MSFIFKILILRSIYYCFLSKAYQIACLNVTDSDWKILAREALENFNLLVAKKAFAHIKEIKYLDLITQYEVNAYYLYILFSEKILLFSLSNLCLRSVEQYINQSIS